MSAEMVYEPIFYGLKLVGWRMFKTNGLLGGPTFIGYRWVL